MPKLWDYFNGEPFMENPHLAIVGNPKRKSISKKGSKNTMAARRRKTGRKNASRRRSRRNFSTAGLAFNRPRRRRRARTYRMNRTRSGHYAYNPRRRSHRRRSRSNPAVLGVTLPPIQMIGWGVGGFLAPPMVENFINQFIPVEFGSTVLGRYAVKIGSVLGLTYLTKNVMSAREAFPVALGGTMYVVVSAINEFVPQLVVQPPAAPVQAYRSGMIKAYRSGMITHGINAGMNQYSKTNLAQSMPSLAAPRWNLGPSGMQNPTQADPRFAIARHV